VIAHPRGKQLGGSSAINFLWWTHASQQDINNWGTLGNNNWSWATLNPFFRKSERFLTPSERTEQDLQTGYLDPNLHGMNGPITTSYANLSWELDHAWPRTYQNLDLAVNGDPRDGLALGGYTNLLNLDSNAGTRSYAATTYLREAEKRSNFKVHTGCHVSRILFDTTSARPRAIGAVYTRNGTYQTIHARKEVILSAGAFGSPQILELSGIGDEKLLKSHGIAPIVSNSHVGENLQDHAYVPVGYRVRPEVFTLEDLANETLFNEAYEQYEENRTGILSTTSAMSALLSLDQIGGRNLAGLEDAVEEHCSADLNLTINRYTGEQKRHAFLCAALQSEAVTQEFATPSGMNPHLANDSARLFTAITPGKFFTIVGVLQHPFSRGHVHISSPDPLEYPRIDPQYLSHPLDIKLLSAMALHVQRVARTEPLSGLLEGDGSVYQPEYYELDGGNVEAWVRESLQSEFHPCGTCAMLPQEEGGVVDAKFRVYGVDGLRVVDASIFPMIPRANIQSLVYAVAERAAEFIRE
jgi:choline dehydrogenase-like flavoprotein